MTLIDDIIKQVDPIAEVFEFLYEKGYIWILIIVLFLGVIIFLFVLPFL